jgi:cytoskeletal protein CcmA (bactofilin family)
MFKSSNKNIIKDSNEVIKNVNKKTTIPSIINAELTLKGDITSDNIIEVFGKIEGNIVCDVLSIREGAIIKGKVVAKYVKIAGSFTGEIKAAIIHITGSGSINGIIEYGIISSEENAKIQGTLLQNSSLLESKVLEGDIVIEKTPEEERNGVLQFKKKKLGNE